jgi:hypothetical protein
LALAKRDAVQANELFSAMMSLYRKSGLFEFRDPFLKLFAVLPHGLYNMAYYFLPSECFEEIIPPKETAFWNKFSEYQRAIGFVQGEPYIIFDGNLGYLNKVYTDIS